MDRRLGLNLMRTVLSPFALPPQGRPGSSGGNATPPFSYPIAGVASFTAAHGLPFPPDAWVVLPSGEVIETDVVHTPGATTVIFPQPFTGTLYLR